MNDKELHKSYKKYIDTNLYHVISSEYIKEIKKNGLNPKKDPYQKIIPDIKKLFSILLRLEKKGFNHKQDWGFKIVSTKHIIKTTLKDINNNFIDFTPWKKETYYYKKRKGGALVTTIKLITNDILKRKPKLTKLQYNLINKLNNWSIKKSKFNNKIIIIKGSSKCLETTHFQRIHTKNKYMKSPFGSFEHFEKIIKKNTLKTYESYLKGDKLFYLRIVDKVPASEIKIV
jgi:hypothetical protein|tara:strand:+ start:675 stop:1364 length:690 start_codon:yes stop_codon:yes gene_type:complete